MTLTIESNVMPREQFIASAHTAGDRLIRVTHVVDPQSLNRAAVQLDSAVGTAFEWACQGYMARRGSCLTRKGAN